MTKWGFVEIPLLQHVGNPAKAIVSPGDRVERGQRIGQQDGMGAHIHSSVRGVVESVGDVVRIIADEHQPDDFVKIPETKTKLEAIEEAGVVGAALMGFPVHVKLDVDLGTHSSGGCVIVNAAECEPGRRHNVQLVEEEPEKIIRALIYCMEITKAQKGYIAISPHHTRAVQAVSKACEPHSNIRLMENMSPTYPVGDERVLVRVLTGHELGPGELPQSVGVLVFNVETMKRIAEAIELRKPVIEKDFTLNGRIVDVFSNGEPLVYMNAPIGYPVARFIEEAGGYLEPYGELVLGGGAFKGYRDKDDAVLTKLMASVFVSMPFPLDMRRFGILACECGAQEDRLTEIVKSMGGSVAAQSHCKRMQPDDEGKLRCTKPGNCPGQAEKIFEFKKQGAEAVIVGTCED